MRRVRVTEATYFFAAGTCDRLASVMSCATASQLLLAPASCSSGCTLYMLRPALCVLVWPSQVCSHRARRAALGAVVTGNRGRSPHVHVYT